jgi:hypothetical protein
MSAHISNVRPEPDQVLVDIADYVLNYQIDSALAFVVVEQTTLTGTANTAQADAARTGAGST